MKFILSVILFLGAVGVFTGLARFSHRQAVEDELKSRSLEVLSGAGFDDVTVKFDHFDAILGGYVDSEGDKKYALALIEERIPQAYVSASNEASIKIRPSLVPWVSVKKEKGVRTVLLEGNLAIDAGEQQKYLGSSLYVVNGVDAVKNEITLDPQRLHLDVATEFAALAAGLIPVSENSEVRYDEEGVFIGGLVENEGVKKSLLELAELLAPGKVTDKLEVKSSASSQNPAEFHVIRSRFGLDVEGTVPDLDTKAKLFGMLVGGKGNRMGDDLDISSRVDKAFWADSALQLVPLLLSRSSGDAAAHFTADRVQISGAVDSVAVRDELQAMLTALKERFQSVEVLSELSILGEDAGSAAAIELNMVFDQLKITLSGRISSQDAKDSISSKIVKKSDKTLIINELIVDNGLRHSEWEDGLPVLLAEIVKRVSKGRVSVKNDEVTLSGTTHSVEEKQLMQNMAVNLFPEDYKVVNLLSYSDQPFPSPDLKPGEKMRIAEALKSLPIYFDMNSDKLKSTEAAKVKVAAKTMTAAVGIYRYSVGGFADSVGNAAYNRSLSIRRAETVKAELIRLGVKADSLNIESFGENLAGAPKSERWRGRRVEINFARKP